MRAKEFKNGTTVLTFNKKLRCVCGCGEGLHVVAAMAKRTCCEKCTGEFRPQERRKKGG